MVAVGVILGILLVLALLLQIRLGVQVQYDEDGFCAAARVARWRIVLFPRPKKTRSQREKAQQKKQLKKEKQQQKQEKKKAKQEKKRLKAEKKKERSKKEEAEEAPKKKGGTLKLILDLLPVVFQALGALKNRLQIDDLQLHFVSGSPDAAQTAIQYGRVSAAAGNLLAQMQEHFRVKKYHVTVDMDFLAEQTTVVLQAGLSIKVGQLLYVGIRYGIAALRVFLKNRSAQKKKAAALAKEAAEKTQKAKDTEPQNK